MKIIEFDLVTNKMIKMMVQDLESLYSKLHINENLEKTESLLGSKIEKWMKNKVISGAICMKDEKMVGFLFAELKNDEEKKQAWVPSFGIATFGADNDKILYELYKHCSSQWVELGYFEHVIETLNIDNQVLSLQMLGFAYQQVHGLLKLSNYKEGKTDAKISIRSLRKNDSDILRDMAEIIYRYQTASPVYAPVKAETINNIRNGFASLVNDDEVMFYISETDRPVAYQALWEVDYGYLIPKKCVELSIAGTYADVSHRGVGTKLMNYVVKDLMLKGYKWLSADWRITNISARRFWNTKCGFNITKYRMIRTIDSDFSWVKAN
ncbi:GNAT family N-acetyltransferase [Alkaliphilus pronyensis]|uniref:GNAT family N-acetyltransferase n=1 Tax=Alkaliphilus pronyensis TaxID=1482732 RepID=A0A6I0FEL3_9FIRM|nr:GNAT family N-acetyltransferase [Alkaliphilus pronyensis]KAB3534074.1 GNAT family N-acetyltransferase [Alkaliphilus pronyensis]